jgi:hypothetical protein
MFRSKPRSRWLQSWARLLGLTTLAGLSAVGLAAPQAPLATQAGAAPLKIGIVGAGQIGTVTQGSRPAIANSGGRRLLGFTDSV